MLRLRVIERGRTVERLECELWKQVIQIQCCLWYLLTWTTYIAALALVSQFIKNTGVHRISLGKKITATLLAQYLIQTNVNIFVTTLVSTQNSLLNSLPEFPIYWTAWMISCITPSQLNKIFWKLNLLFQPTLQPVPPPVFKKKFFFNDRFVFLILFIFV